MSVELQEKQVFMHRPHLRDIQAPELPEGYRECLWTQDREADWTDLLDDVFGNWNIERVRQEFMDQPQWLPERLTLIARDEPAVAVSLAWECRELWPHSGQVHWVGAREAHRRAGLGRYVVARNLQYFAEHDYDDAVLITDEWRLPAIGLYISMGFDPLMTGVAPDERQRWERVFDALRRQDLMARVRDDYAQAIRPLREPGQNP